MNPIETHACHCPWCDAPLEIELDVTGGSRSYVEDCQVCCAPMTVTLELDLDAEDALGVTLAREGD